MRLLADRAPSDVVHEPFPHLVQPHALAAAAYEQLAADFPPLATFRGAATAVGSNVAVRRSARDVLADPSVSSGWRAFFEYHTSEVYWRDVARIFGADFRAAFPDLEARVGRPYETWRVVPRGYEGAAEVRLDCQFVMNTPVTVRSSVKTTHVDQNYKIFSALFYMRDPRDRTAGGDLDLYAWSRTPRFVKHRVLDRDVSRVKTIPYDANCYVAFVNSPRSVHGVSPRDVTDVPRRYVNFIAELPVRAFVPKQVSRLRRMRLRPLSDGADEP